MSLPNPSMSFTPFDTLPAADLNDIVENIESLATGVGMNNNGIAASKLATNAILLGSASVTASQTINAAVTNGTLTGLTTTVTVPAGGRKLQVELYFPQIGATGAAIATVRIWEGTIGSGTNHQTASIKIQDSGDTVSAYISTDPLTLSAGSYTFSASASIAANNTTFTHSATSKAYIAVKLV